LVRHPPDIAASSTRCTLHAERAEQLPGPFVVVLCGE
jgi:hypothetical protein